MISDYGVSQNEHHATAEARVWQAVILQTIEEWLHGPLRRSLQAESYLFTDNVDFPMVCEQAGMDVGRLRSGLNRIRNRVVRPQGLPVAA
jgi:hypothetical protein